MIAGLKAFFPSAALTRQNQWKSDGLPWPVREMYQIDIGLIGASKIGRHVIRLLKNFEVNVLLYDPHVSSEEAEATLASLLGARHVIQHPLQSAG